MPSEPSPGRSVLMHRIFEAGVFIKLFHAGIELVASVFIFFKAMSFQAFLMDVSSAELREDPNDFLANFIFQKSTHISHASRDVAAFYLFAAALLNIILAIGLLRHKKAMFPISVALLGLFAAFQMYFFFRTFSPWLLVLSAYDLVFIYLVYREYQTRWGSSS